MSGRARRRAAGVLIAIGAAVAGGWRMGPLLGLAALLLTEWLGRRSDSAGDRVLGRRTALDLPIAIDLIAASLRAGAPPQRAVQAVGQALGGPIGQRLEAVATSMAAGRDPATCWAHLIDLPIGARVARAAARSADSGAALSGTLSRFADDLRVERAAAAEAATRRLSVFVVIPLGLCYLPAFLLAGVVPVVLAVLARVLAGS